MIMKTEILLEKLKKRPAIMWDRRYAKAFFNLYLDTFGLPQERHGMSSREKVTPPDSANLEKPNSACRQESPICKEVAPPWQLDKSSLRGANRCLKLATRDCLQAFGHLFSGCSELLGFLMPERLFYCKSAAIRLLLKIPLFLRSPSRKASSWAFQQRLKFER